ncbi:hypothetical protein J2S74_003007 [Evansella vedderi]|uniref:Uncharacterized protein n=1 Tax=Evansella vedderi TaxID=38282 RepID=A0ABT9ZZW3_9BACI|nr:hypothetical protein [Evansella vedderi]MDQ0255625.1 hypothetical protein [Evansella vedderi]
MPPYKSFIYIPLWVVIFVGIAYFAGYGFYSIVNFVGWSISGQPLAVLSYGLLLNAMFIPVIYFGDKCLLKKDMEALIPINPKTDLTKRDKKLLVKMLYTKYVYIGKRLKRVKEIRHKSSEEFEIVLKSNTLEVMEHLVQRVISDQELTNEHIKIINLLFNKKFNIGLEVIKLSTLNEWYEKKPKYKIEMIKELIGNGYWLLDGYGYIKVLRAEQTDGRNYYDQNSH